MTKRRWWSCKVWASDRKPINCDIFHIMEVIFFNSKIEDNLYSLDKTPLDKCLRLIDLLKMFGNKLNMPYSKKISRNIYELRARGQQEIRIFYCFHQDRAVIVHHFIKKSQKTPKREVETALNRTSLLH